MRHPLLGLSSFPETNFWGNCRISSNGKNVTHLRDASIDKFQTYSGDLVKSEGTKHDKSKGSCFAHACRA